MAKHLALLVLALTLISPAVAAEWPQWRGPLFNGSTDERNLPSQWSRTENVAWSTDLSGEAASTPVVCGDRIFLTDTDAEHDTLLAVCIDRVSGKIVWRHEVGKGISKDRRSNFAAASAVTDGKIAVFFFGTGEMIGYDLAGSQLWRRNIQTDYGPFAFLWTFSSSPVLYEGKLYQQVLQRDVPVDGRGLTDRENESYLLAMDPATGKTLWRQVRPSQARMESREAFSTPVPYEYQGRKQLLVAGGDDLTAHDPATGQELWRWGTWNPERITHWRYVPSPAAGDGIALACGPKNSPIYAVRTDGSGRLDDTALAWVSRGVKEITSDVPTPAFYDGDFFILSDVRRALSRVEPRTGKVKWTVPVPGAKHEASPTAADGKIYVISHQGQATVFNAADGSTLHAVAMDEPAGNEVVRSSIVAAHGQLLIRTTRKLYCIGR
jgi:outer membrane protein assembly factor BamB